MGEREFKIRISGDASGIAAASRQGAEALGETTGATEKGTAANKEHARSFVHVEKEGRAFHKLLHGLTEEFPIAGIAFRAFINPVTAGLLGATMLMRAFKEAEEEAIKSAQEFANEAAKPWGDTKQAISEAIDKIHEMQTAHHDFLAHLQDDNKKIIEELNAATEKMKLELGVLLKLKNIQAGGEMAPGIEPSERFGLAEIQQEARLTDEALGATRQKRVEAGEKLSLLESAAENPERAKLLKELPAIISRAKEEMETAQKRADDPEFAKRLEQFHGAGLTDAQIRGDVVFGPRMRQHEENLRLVESNKTLMEKAQDRLSRITAEQDAATTAAGHARDTLKQLTEQEKNLQDKSTSLHERANITGAGITLREGGLGSILSAGSMGLRELREHHGNLNELSSDMQNAIHGVRFVGQALGVNIRQFMAWVQSLQGDVTALAEATKIIQQRQERMARNYQ